LRFATLAAEVSSHLIDVGNEYIYSKVPSMEVEVRSMQVKVPLMEVEVRSMEVQVPSMEVEVRSMEVEVPSMQVKAPLMQVKAPLIRVQPCIMGIERGEVILCWGWRSLFLVPRYQAPIKSNQDREDDMYPY
jgi:hypothetical protein